MKPLMRFGLHTRGTVGNVCTRRQQPSLRRTSEAPLQPAPFRGRPVAGWSGPGACVRESTSASVLCSCESASAPPRHMHQGLRILQRCMLSALRRRARSALLARARSNAHERAPLAVGRGPVADDLSAVEVGRPVKVLDGRVAALHARGR